MTDLAIRVEGLSKRYSIHGAKKRPDTLRDELSEALKTLWTRHGFRRDRENFWALKDISFEIRQGEVVGIIGPNGAGKSTLLKILAKITEPTCGRAEIYGRVGSLLEVGTGFHSELSGRDNIYLNGAILGMKKSEIDRKFDEIVAFAEIEKFIDTPVKRYSSGMYVRLGFAVAAHLEPEVLIVDEVLAVGDVAFRKKCLGKMDDIAKQGRTILLVSHDMTAISNFSTEVAFLDRGLLRHMGSPGEVVRAYLQDVAVGTARGKCVLEPPVDFPFFVTAVWTSDDLNLQTAVLSRSRALEITVQGEVQEARPNSDEYLIAVDIKTVDDMLLFRTHNIEQPGFGEIPHRIGPFTLKCVIPPDLFPAGTYRVGIHTAIAGKRYLQNVYPVLEFDVIQDRLLGNIFASTHGILTPRCDWIAQNDGNIDAK
jgi:homopolymeric O-antigen transport system ATP-binding protein